MTRPSLTPSPSPLYPEVTLGQYKGLSAERYPAEVDEDEIGYELEAPRKRNSRKVDVEREAQMGDVANIDFDGYLNGERFDGGKAEAYDLELGSGSFVPGFEEQIVGMNIGDEKDIDITFPENYAPELAGKAVVFKIKLNNLSVNEPPELDDEFAKDNGFDTLDEYKADVKADLEKRKTEQTRRRGPRRPHAQGHREHDRCGSRGHGQGEGRGDHPQLRKKLRRDR